MLDAASELQMGDDDSPMGMRERTSLLNNVQQFARHTQREIAFAFVHAAPTGSGCYGPIDKPVGVAPDIKVDAPACSAASQWGSGKWKLSDAFSMEFTYGIQDAGFRVVIGGGIGGIGGGPAGGTHDVDQMDFSFVSAI